MPQEMNNWEDWCPCGHGWDRHTKELGCNFGWRYSSEGIATEEGCECRLAHSEKSPAEFIVTPPECMEVIDE